MSLPAPSSEWGVQTWGAIPWGANYPSSSALVISPATLSQRQLFAPSINGGAVPVIRNLNMILGPVLAQ